MKGMTVISCLVQYLLAKVIVHATVLDTTATAHVILLLRACLLAS